MAELFAIEVRVLATHLSPPTLQRRGISTFNLYDADLLLTLLAESSGLAQGFLTRVGKIDRRARVDYIHSFLAR